MFFSRLEELIFVLKENYASYRVKPDRPAQEAGGGYSDASLTKAINDNVDNFANFMFTQMFKAAAPENVRRLLSHKDQTRLTNRTSRLSDRNRGRKIERFNRTPTGATIAQEVRTTGPITTTATGRTIRTTTNPISPNPATPETVNSVHTAKF
jgi:hypothetical protein